MAKCSISQKKNNAKAFRQKVKICESVPLRKVTFRPNSQCLDRCEPCWTQTSCKLCISKTSLHKRSSRESDHSLQKPCLSGIKEAITEKGMINQTHYLSLFAFETLLFKTKAKQLYSLKLTKY